MKKTVLDFSECKYWHDLEKVIKTTLDFPDYYGENLSALWDCGRDYVYDVKPVIIEILGSHKYADLSKQHNDYINGILSVFQRLNDRITDVKVEVVS